MAKIAALAILRSGEGATRVIVNSPTVASGCSIARDSSSTMSVVAILNDSGQMSASAATCFASIVAGGYVASGPTTFEDAASGGV